MHTGKTFKGGRITFISLTGSKIHDVIYVAHLSWFSLKYSYKLSTDSLNSGNVYRSKNSKY